MTPTTPPRTRTSTQTTTPTNQRVSQGNNLPPPVRQQQVVQQAIPNHLILPVFNNNTGQSYVLRPRNQTNPPVARVAPPPPTAPSGTLESQKSVTDPRVFQG